MAEPLETLDFQAILVGSSGSGGVSGGSSPYPKIR
jgi:hypothetical protein